MRFNTISLILGSVFAESKADDWHTCDSKGKLPLQPTIIKKDSASQKVAALTCLFPFILPFDQIPPPEFHDSNISPSASSASSTTQAKSSSLPLQPHKHAFINGTAAPPPSSTSQPNMPVKKLASGAITGGGAPAAVGSGGAAKVKRGLKRL